jgi:hypothetical protein
VILSQPNACAALTPAMHPWSRALQVRLPPCTILQPHTHGHSEFAYTLAGGCRTARVCELVWGGPFSGCRFISKLPWPVAPEVMTATMYLMWHLRSQLVTVLPAPSLVHDCQKSMLTNTRAGKLTHSTPYNNLTLATLSPNNGVADCAVGGFAVFAAGEQVCSSVLLSKHRTFLCLLPGMTLLARR